MKSLFTLAVMLLASPVSAEPPPAADLALEYQNARGLVLAKDGQPRMQATASSPEAPRKAVLLPQGIPLLAYGNCSGSVVRSDAWPQPVMFSAWHCFGKSGVNSNKPESGYASGSALGLYNPAASAVTFTPGAGDAQKANDIIAAKAHQVDASKVEVLELAETVPAEGESVTLRGYPGKGIPGLAHVSSLDELRCEQMGMLLAPTPVEYSSCGGTPRLAMFQMLRCPKTTFVQGYSGGGVTDSSGRFVGVFSNFVDAYKLDLDAATDRFSYLEYSAVTKRPLPGFIPDPSATFTFVPPLSGTFENQAFFMLLLDPDRKTRRSRPSDCSANEEVPVPPIVIVRRTFTQVRLKDGLVDGELIDDSGEKRLIETWKEGVLVSSALVEKP